MSRHNPQPAIDRLRARIEVDPETGCHNWTGSTGPLGYGYISEGGRGADGKRRSLSTHRVAYTAAKGPIPAGLVIDHLCRNRRCCNPEHLEAVTHQENMRRGSFGRRTHCKWGHEYTPENTYLLPRGRQCRECRRLKVAARRRSPPATASLPEWNALTNEQRAAICDEAELWSFDQCLERSAACAIYAKIRQVLAAADGLPEDEQHIPKASQ